MKQVRPVWYFLLAAAVFGLDRWTKWLAQTYCVYPCTLNSFVSFELVHNPGITWGLFRAMPGLATIVLTIMVILVTGVLVAIGYRRYSSGYTVFPEALVIGGSCSNILDRMIYGGVLDFIVLSYKQWNWPVFNIADIFIVIGVIWLGLEIYNSQELE